MRLYLLRHAEATYDAPSDEARELTPKGERSIGKLCQRLKTKEFAGLTQLHHSNLTRARQTAELFNEGLQLQLPLVETAGLAPMDNPMALGPMLLESASDLMLIGHNPHLSILAAWLLTGNPHAACIDFKKSGLLCLERGSPPNAARGAGVWALSWYLVNRPVSD